MRKTHKKQLSLVEPAPVHPKAQEWAEISRILDRNTIIYEKALQDLTRGVKHVEVGSEGMTAEQVVRVAIIKQLERCSYRDLAFLIVDSRVFGEFCKLGIGDKPFKKSTLQTNITALTANTWEEIHRITMKDAEKNDIEKGRKVRIDCTVVESNIHAPYDSQLLWDAVRVLDRLLGRARAELPGVHFPYSNHSKRKKQYKDLVGITRTVIGYAQAALPELKQYRAGNLTHASLAIGITKELAHYIPLALQVVEQTERRVIHGEAVPAAEKIVSIFEEHTDIIRKDRRETHYGHKVCLTGGASNLILDCQILAGNPADSTLVDEMFDRQNEIYGRYPLKASLDGGFASLDNLKSAKKNGIKDVCFAKGKGLEESEMCRSHYVFKTLRRFRAGIESGISWLKRCFGFDRCFWKGSESFRSYVWATIVSANLLTMARKQLA